MSRLTAEELAEMRRLHWNCAVSACRVRRILAELDAVIAERDEARALVRRAEGLGFRSIVEAIARWDSK